MLTEYTTFDDVRAALGMSEEEISDETLGLEVIETLHEEDLLAVSVSLLPAWAALPDLDVQSVAEKRFYKLVRLYSTYAVAYLLLGNSELLGFVKVTDGRASVERSARAFENLRVSVSAMRVKVQNLLLQALLVLVPAAEVTAVAEISYVSSTGIALDPVTGA